MSERNTDIEIKKPPVRIVEPEKIASEIVDILAANGANIGMVDRIFVRAKQIIEFQQVGSVTKKIGRCEV